jgi:CubicO group peptidase (beta-lactamase class C family)
VDAATTMTAYSMSKTITAVAPLAACREGQSWARCFSRTILGPLSYGSHVTVPQLLSHTVRLPESDSLRSGSIQRSAMRASMRTLRSQPSPRSSASVVRARREIRVLKYGYWLLGAVVERVSAGSYPRYVMRSPTTAGH